MSYKSTKVIELGSCAFRQWRADSHCKFVHGYRLVAKFEFGCYALDHRNWVVDFGGLKRLKQILEKQFDHTFCVSADDPLLQKFKELHDLGAVDLRIMHNGVGIERTAEWCFEAANNLITIQTNGRCWVERVEVWEHEKNSAIVVAENKQISQYTNQQHNTNNPTNDFINEVEKETGVHLGNVLKNIPPQVDQPAPSTNQNGPRPAPLVNRVTTGYSNLFGGTSWGS